MNIITNELKEDVKRNLGNFARVPSWNTMMTSDQVDYLFEINSDTVFCNGHLRQLKMDMITPNYFKVYTIPFN